MHLVGLNGMTRRIYTYRPNWAGNFDNLLATTGAFVIIALGACCLSRTCFKAGMKGRVAGEADPWDAPTLEWAAASPPAPFNFANLPLVTRSQPSVDAESGICGRDAK